MKESNASLETSTQNNQATSQPDKSITDKNAPTKQQDHQPNKPRDLAALFADPTDESNTEIYLDEDTPDDPNAPLDSLDRLMKRNKLTQEQVYAIKVPMRNGAEALTIGQLKDKAGELTDFEMRVSEFEERRIKQEGNLLKSQAELRSLLEMLPKEAIKPEVLAKLREQQDTTVRRERQLTLEHISEWRDEKRRTSDLEGMVEMLSDYGFDASFLESVVDHRAMKFIRDTFLIRQRIKKSLEQVRDPKRLGARPSGKAAKAAHKPVSSNRRTPAPSQADRIAQWFQSKE